MVGGMPDFDRLSSGLARLREGTTSIQAPNPTELGFPAFCDGVMTEHCLHVRSHALTKWSHALESLSRRPTNKQRSQQIACEFEEIKQLQRRLVELHDLRRRLEAGKNPAEAPYVLDACREEQLSCLLADGAAHRRKHQLHARIVFWIAGAEAAARYLQAIRPLSCLTEKLTRVEQLHKLRQQLLVWKQRSQNEPRRQIHREMRAVISALPHELVSKAQLTARLRAATLTEHCELLLERCTAALHSLQDAWMDRVPGEIAAFVICDGGNAPVPSRLVKQFAEDGDYSAFHGAMGAIFHERGKPCFDELLVTVDQLDSLPSLHEYLSIRELLSKRVSLEDIRWAQQRNLLGYFHTPCIEPSWVRSFVERLKQRRIDLDPDELAQLLQEVQAPADLQLLDQWAQWLRILTPATITPKLRTLLVKSLLDHVLPCISNLGCHRQLHDLLRPPARQCEGVDAPYDAWPTLAPWLHRIGYYQQVCHGRVGVPKSIRKRLDASVRLKQEHLHLGRLQRQGIANEKQIARLRHLEGQCVQGDHVARSRLVRDAESVYVITAMEAFRATLYQAAFERWHRTVGFALPQELASRAVEMAQWVQRMDPPRRRMACDVLRAWTDHRESYKRHLPTNATWLERARSCDVNLDQWLIPDTWQTQANGQDVSISVSTDPYRTFQMGALFNTCLSFGECNEMSLLANAYDANKQVVYMSDMSGKILARQLVAVSDRFELLGYYCYCIAGNDEQEVRDQIIGTMAAYCGRWARRCGLTLADDGEPTMMGDHFWYDDGAWAWHQGAKENWGTTER